MAKVPQIDKGACIGCGLCTATCSNTFKLGSDGKAEVANPSGESEQEIQTAIDSCPVQAISWKE